MKVIGVVFALFLAGVSALPSHQQFSEVETAIRSGDSRFTVNTIVNIIEDLAQSIVDAGLDPFHFEGLEVDYAAPVPTVFSAQGRLRGVSSRGLSNIVINRMNYALLTSRLTFNIELPGIVASIVDSAWNVNILSGNLNGAFSGSIAVRNIAVDGNVRISIGILSGISIREMTIKASIGAIESHLHLYLQDVNLSAPLNKFLGETIPNELKDYKNDINELITIVARQVVEGML